MLKNGKLVFLANADSNGIKDICRNTRRPPTYAAIGEIEMKTSSKTSKHLVLSLL